MNKIFINSLEDSWILTFIANDIKKELESRGFICRKGKAPDYKGEEICLHMWWRNAQPYTQAKHNSVFITHTDDSFKEKELLSIKNCFNSFICMSEEDRQFLIELGFDKNKVYGLDLPVRNTYLKPFSIGIFSNCYSDNRKNENWLLEYCKQNSKTLLVNFVFIGSGWGEFVEELSKIGCSFEWHSASRELPYEYFFQQNKLSNLDLYLYMGMDGGAMGTYDAYAMGVPLCISDDGYHKSIPNVNYSFSTQKEMFNCLDNILLKVECRYNFYTNNSIVKYVDSLLGIWNGDFIMKSNKEFAYSVLEKRRKNYFPFSLIRFKHFLFQKKAKSKLSKFYK